MTDKSLNKLLDTLNKGLRKEHVFIRKLNETVDFVKVFNDNPKMNDRISYYDIIPDTFYCIKENDQYVGIVYDMNSDLHWYMKKEHRGNGHLTKALKETILPFIFRNRDEQRITISRYEIGEENFKASEKVALNSGFKFQKEIDEKYEYLIKHDDCDLSDLPEGINEILSKEELKEIAQKVFFYTKKLSRLQTKLEMCYDPDYKTITDFKNRIERLKFMSKRIEDIWYDFKEM